MALHDSLSSPCLHTVPFAAFGGAKSQIKINEKALPFSALNIVAMSGSSFSCLTSPDDSSPLATLLSTCLCDPVLS